LKAEINWHRMFHELIEDFDPVELEKRQKKALRDAKVPQANPASVRKKRD